MGKYLYGIVRERCEDRLGVCGIGGAPVHTIAYRDIAALASESSPICPAAIPKEELPRLIAAHQSVLEKFAALWPVLPLKFGTMAEDCQEVRAILERSRPQLVAALESAQGKVELDVVALWSDLPAQLRRIAEEDGLRPAPHSLKGFSYAQVREAQLELGRRLQSVLLSQAEKFRAEISPCLQSLATTFIQRDSADDSIILNAAFWLDRSAVPAFEALLGEFQARRDEIYIRRLGPLPPYSFLTAEVRKIDPAALERARKLFGLQEGAGASEVQEKYRSLARELHPDQHPGDPEASKRFEGVTASYRTLLDYCRQGGALAIFVPELVSAPALLGVSQP